MRFLNHLLIPKFVILKTLIIHMNCNKLILKPIIDFIIWSTVYSLACIAANPLKRKYSSSFRIVISIESCAWIDTVKPIFNPTKVFLLWWTYLKESIRNIFIIAVLTTFLQRNLSLIHVISSTINMSPFNVKCRHSAISLFFQKLWLLILLICVHCETNSKLQADFVAEYIIWTEVYMLNRFFKLRVIS